MSARSSRKKKDKRNQETRGSSQKQIAAGQAGKSSQPEKSTRPAMTKEQFNAYGSYGVKRTTGVSPAAPQPANPAPAAPRRRRLWPWLVGGLFLILLAGGFFVYSRVSSFVDNSFSGRNEASLLTKAPALKPTQTPAPAVNSAKATPASYAVSAPTVTPRITPTPEPAAPLAPIIQKIKDGEPLTALVVGYGGGKHDGAYLTDTILMMTYDPARNAVSMVNIPRDLYVFIPYGGQKVGFYGKINSAFSYVMESANSSGLSPRYRFDANDPRSRVDGAVNLLKDIVEQVTGTPVDYWATFSFDGFRKFIDAIGGVNVNVDIAFDDYEYPANDDPSIDASVKHIHFDAGPQHLMGERAIEYARSRKSLQDGSDFGRSKRQMKVVSAVKERVSQPDIMLRAFGMMDALQGSLRTSLSLDSARALMDYFKGGEGAQEARNMLFVSNILSGNFLVDSMSSEGAYILVPAAGQNNYKTIQAWLERGREFPQLRAEGLKVQIQNGSGQQLPTLQLTDLLENNGLDTLAAAWANPTGASVILDYSGGKATSTIKAISDLLPGLSAKSAKKPYPAAADVVVLLGKDYPAIANGQETGESKAGSSSTLKGGPNALNLPSDTPGTTPAGRVSSR